MTHKEALILRSAAGSDVGRQRSGNEDSVYVSDRLLAVADGMGGHVAGEVASAQAKAAMETLNTRLSQQHSADVDLVAELTSGVTDAATRLAERVAADPELNNMGTTVTALLWAGSQFALAHIGDTRCYLFRESTLTQLTSDHTMAQLLVDQGSMSAELVARHPGRSVLVRALMAEPSGEPDLSLHTAHHGDRYLLCSDGLTDVVTTDQLHDVLARAIPPDEAVRTLIDLANDAGGPDNISCIVTDVVGEREEEPVPTEQDGG